VTLTVRVDQPGAKIDPIFYGLMNEEINFSYDGGLYAELVRNRTFQDRGKIPPSWFLYEWGDADASMDIDRTTGPSAALPLRSLFAFSSTISKRLFLLTSKANRQTFTFILLNFYTLPRGTSDV